MLVTVAYKNYINVEGGCRPQEREKCESLCQVVNHKRICELRASVILPYSELIEASMPRVSFI